MPELELWFPQIEGFRGRGDPQNSTILKCRDPPEKGNLNVGEPLNGPALAASKGYPKP